MGYNKDTNSTTIGCQHDSGEYRVFTVQGNWTDKQAKLLKELGYSNIFGVRATIDEAVDYSAQLLESITSTEKMASYTAMMVYVNTMLAHIVSNYDLTPKKANTTETTTEPAKESC